jgi:hypothetical protein
VILNRCRRTLGSIPDHVIHSRGTFLQESSSETSYGRQPNHDHGGGEQRAIHPATPSGQLVLLTTIWAPVKSATGPGWMRRTTMASMLRP